MQDVAAAATRTSPTTDQGEPTDGGDPRLQADTADDDAADAADAAPTQHTEKEPTA